MTNTPSVTLHMINDEMRIHDLELAARLRCSKRIKLRDLIKRHVNELAAYGFLATVEKASEVDGGRPSEEFFLNEGQAIRIAVLADVLDTQTVCEMVVKAYADYRRGLTSITAPTPDLAPVLSILQQMAETLAHLTKHMVSR
ncbi:hypothetical protein [Rhizobium sp. NZLR4b]|uniref:hypothetical protein n=1 Tax=Rhizobium sp. NZLR4b TaxID=2731102 RepID=UPI001C83C9E1|nr:hypothetical protein [Rhizobium sp. NZLR4b]MBX5165703.1 hypothetical protein [Rhizobium sp. NZLR4b]